MFDTLLLLHTILQPSNWTKPICWPFTSSPLLLMWFLRLISSWLNHYTGYTHTSYVTLHMYIYVYTFVQLRDCFHHASSQYVKYICQCISYTALWNQHLSTQYREGLASDNMPTPDVILGLHLYFTHCCFIKEHYVSYLNTNLWKVVNKRPYKRSDFTRASNTSSSCPPWTRYCDGPKEVVSIRAIWERISLVGPVPAKHVAFFAPYLHTWDLQNIFPLKFIISLFLSWIKIPLLVF